MTGRSLFCLAGTAFVSACSPTPVTVADVRHYTGIGLCDAAGLKDLTTQQERDTVPGFSYHVALNLNATCEASFRRQLAQLPTSSCYAAADLSGGCFVQDAYPTASKHTSIVVTSLGSGRYDMSFYE